MNSFPAILPLWGVCVHILWREQTRLTQAAQLQIAWSVVVRRWARKKFGLGAVGGAFSGFRDIVDGHALSGLAQWALEWIGEPVPAGV